MKGKVIVLAFGALTAAAVVAQQAIDFSPAIQAMRSISGKEAFDHAQFLASQEMRGRDTASTEQDIAARYIANEFRKYGLKPVGDDSTFFQNFVIEEVELGQNNRLEITTVFKEKSGHQTQVSKPFQLGFDFLPARNSETYRIDNAEVVFVGYSITAPEYKYDDYANIDVTGKVVLALTHEPQEMDTTSVFDKNRDTRYSSNSLKAAFASHHGAIALLLATDPRNHPKRKINRNSWKRLADPMALVDQRATPQLRLRDEEATIPVFEVGDKVVEELFKNTGTSLLELQKKIDADLKPRPILLPRKWVSLQSEVDLVAERNGRNVVGYLKGQDPIHREEVVVIGAHYDHYGVNPKGEVFHGANDNAGGTVTTLEIAQAFTASPVKPKRSLLFIAFTGEELGLWGSRYYADHPIFPMEKTVAMLNLDVMSRDDSYKKEGDTLHTTIFFANVSPELKRINEEAVRQVGQPLKITFSDWLLARSDHAPFFWKGVPVLFYAGGPSSGGHSPQDVADKLNPAEMEAIGRLTFLTAWAVGYNLITPAISLPAK